MFTRTTVRKPKKVDSLECGKISLNATCKIVGVFIKWHLQFCGEQMRAKKTILLNGKIKNVVGFGAEKCNIINLYVIM